MGAFFETAERRETLARVLQEWVGTPFRHRAGVKGVGADCSHFLAAVLKEVGHPGRFAWPDYPPDWNLHSPREILYEGVSAQLKTENVTHDLVTDGDLLFFRFGRAMGHMGIFCSGRLYHAAYRIGVVSESYPDRMWAKRLGAILRILE